MTVLMGLFTFRQMRRTKARKEAEANGQVNEQDSTDEATGAAGVEGGTTGGTDDGNAAGANTGAADDNNSTGNVPDSTPGARLTPERLAEIMKNKGNVMAALKEYGAEFSDRDGADILRQQLEAVLVAKELMPVGEGDGDN